MRRVNVRKRGKVYQYQFEIGTINGKRKFINKSGFKTQNEAYAAGQIAYEKYINRGVTFKQSQMLYSDYLDYWMKQYCQINLQYRTIETYHTVIEAHIKPKLGFYRLSQITTSAIQEFINVLYVERGFSKAYLKSILKIVKSSFAYAFDVVGFIKYNPALKVKIPKYDPSEETDSVHV